MGRTGEITSPPGGAEGAGDAPLDILAMTLRVRAAQATARATTCRDRGGP